MENITANFDETWKEAISDYFDDFLNFFFTDLFQLIDWSKKPVSLDKELEQITASSDSGKKVADKLFKVWLLDKREIWILVHVEVQSQYESEFAQRMYVYNYRAFDLYRKPVISLAILGDESKSWRPNSYSYALAGCEVKITFPSIKLLDYESLWQDLEQNVNPFAIMVMAHLKTKSTTNNFTEREKWKWSFIRSLYEKGYTKTQIIKLFKLIDLMMSLPKQLQTSLEQKITNYEEGKKMPLLSNMERRGLERGLEQGLETGLERGKRQNLQENIVQVLQSKFENIPDDLINKINGINDIPSLEKIFSDSLLVNSLNDFQQLIPQD